MGLAVFATDFSLFPRAGCIIGGCFSLFLQGNINTCNFAVFDNDSLIVI